MSKSFAAALAAFLLSSASATAATVVDGNYITTIDTICQPTLAVHFNGQNQADLVTLDPGSTKQEIILAKFNSAKGKVSFSGTANTGSPVQLVLTGNQNGSTGDPFTQQSESGNSSYSNTDTTLTIGSQVYAALFGTANKKGVATSIALSAVGTDDSGHSCTTTGTGTLQ